MLYIYLRPKDVGALLANRALRQLSHACPETMIGDDAAQHEMFTARDFTYTFALAMHPTLNTFKVSTSLHPFPASILSAEQRAELEAAWNTMLRPSSKFSLDI